MEHPGLKLEREIKNSGMTQKEIALRTGVSEKHISTIISGDRNISPSFAKKLGYVIKDEKYWIKTQADYDAEQLAIKEENEITQEEVNILKSLREITSYFIEKNYIHNDCGDVQKIIQLRSFLNISNLTLIPQITYNAAYRAQLSTNVKIDPYVLFAWQRLCEKETENIPVYNNLDIGFLQNNLNEIKKIMFGDITNGIHELQNIFSKCGIVFQVVKNFTGAPVQGFIKETKDKRLILCLTIRRKRADTFWFTLFHEIAHILNEDYTNRFVDFDSIDSEKEIRANNFARDHLISPELYKKFLNSGNYNTWKGIENFAQEAEVQPFIVLGRLQNDGILDWSSFPDKIVKYNWVE